MKHLYQLITISLILAISLPGFAENPAQRQKARPKGTTSLPYGYYEYLPADYSSKSNLPVVIFFHGIAEKGNGTTNLPRVLKNGPPKLVRQGKDFPFILITPQHPTGWWNSSTVETLLKYVKSHYKVDPNRIYVTGLSAGGFGTWTAGGSAADELAAIVPVCGCGNNKRASNMKKLSIWAFHNDNDPKIKSSCTTGMVNAIKSAGGNAKITIYHKKAHDAWTATYNNPDMWSWLLSQRRGKSPSSPSPSPGGNKLPLVDAGSDKTITLPSNALSITATASDKDGSITSYAWTKVSGPGVTMTNVSKSALKLSSLIKGTYVFKITVKDNKNAASSDEVKVTVNDKNSPKNSLPLVNAGSDKTITLPINSLSLSSTSSDKDGKIASRKWTKVSGPSATLSKSTTSTLSLSKLVKGTYVFKLTVKDDDGASASDEVKVIVNASTPKNSPPVVDAGSDRTITLPSNTLTLSADCTDKDGSVTYTLWTKMSGPSVSMANKSQRTMHLSKLVEGTYLFRITVKDNDGGITIDEVKVIVKENKPTQNIAPTVTAGKDKIITLPNNSTSIAAIYEDKDGDVTTGHWVKVSGPSVKMIDIDQPTLKLDNLVAGTYVFKVIVKDNKNATGSDEVKVIVKKSSTARFEESIAEQATSTEFSIFPNPVVDQFKVTSNSDQEVGVKVLIFTSTNGTKVYEEDVTISSDGSSQDINVSSLAPGMYLVKIVSGSNQKTLRLIKQ